MEKKKATPKQTTIGCLLTLGIFLILFFWFRSCTSTGENDQPKAELTEAEQRKLNIEKCFSGWDGSYSSLTPIIKQSLNDEDSYKHINTTYVDRDSFLIVSTEFSAKNGFGGVIKNSVTIKADMDCNIIEIIEWFE